jgi:hypothetical protein
MDKQELSPGEELNQLSRLLFGAAAMKWYLAVLLQLFAGVGAAILSAFELAGDAALIGAMVGIGVLVVAYALRVWSEYQYGTAETMRRQSVLTEAVGWPVMPWQLAEWRRQAGSSIWRRLTTRRRDPNYYTTKAEPGPLRFADMTIESAFYTRNVYLKLQFWAWALFGGAVGVVVVVIFFALTQTIPDTADVVVARTLFTLIPTVLAVNVLGWALRLGRLSAAIRNVEVGLEELKERGPVDERQVMRQVSEYNCQVACGLPIPNWLFSRWNDEIRELWDARQAPTDSNARGQPSKDLDSLTPPKFGSQRLIRPPLDFARCHRGVGSQ